MAENKRQKLNAPKVELLIRDIMREKGIGVKQLGEALGLSHSTIDTKLKGNMTINALYDIAQVLECEIADFFPRKDSKDTLIPTVNGEESRTTPVTEGEHDVFCPRCGAKFRMY
jgi:transcriptional regulator with XRE-family HTH domain